MGAWGWGQGTRWTPPSCVHPTLLDNGQNFLLVLSPVLLVELGSLAVGGAVRVGLIKERLEGGRGQGVRRERSEGEGGGGGRGVRGGGREGEKEGVL